MTIYALSYQRSGQPVTERFESMTARNLRIFALPPIAVQTWLETSDVEPRNEQIVVGHARHVLEGKA